MDTGTILVSCEIAPAGIAPAGIARANTGPAIGIVVPLFKHSTLIGDAIASLLAQTAGLDCIIAVVNDGCPFGESGEHVRALRAAAAADIRYVLQPNAGLSAARNTGIEVILRHAPSVQAIYFMDSDNRLRPGGLQAAFGRLHATPDASWVYPNIDMFGIGQHFDYSGSYSAFKHAFYNICEAGSLVHRRVFDAGIRFDPLMRSGYEDWEFWLQAQEAGFLGVHEPHFGFLYRNRAESMLSQSKRDEDAILAYVRNKHKRLWQRARLHELEDASGPRHAIIFIDTDEVMVGLSATTSLTHEHFKTILWRNAVATHLQHVPHYLLFTTRETYTRLTEAGLLSLAVHNCQTALANHDIATIELAAAEGCAFTIKPGAHARGAHLIATTRDILAAILRDADTKWIEQLPTANPSLRLANRTLSFPQGTRLPSPAVVFGFLYLVMRWHDSPFRAAASQAWEWRVRSVPPSHRLHHDLSHRLGGQPGYPHVPDGRRSIGFALPMGAFGGVERVAYNIAAIFNASGWSTHLFMIGTGEVMIPEGFATAFSTINFLDDRQLADWDATRQYQGTALAACAADPAVAGRIAGALGWLDVVVNHHSGALGAAASLLRRGGTRVMTHLHLLDQSPSGRPTGHAMLALAYEHAYDTIICGSARLQSWMRAAGVPADKLLLVQNGPGYPLARDTSHTIRTARAQRAGKRLNTLFLGRLDRQKGIFRLAELIDLTRSQGLDIAWRVVGGAVIDSPTLPPVITALVEPPVTNGRDLSTLFAWADVMVLLSDFEGVPLSILEAQRLGVCVIATKVGGVSEVIENGRTGFTVPLETAVGDTASLLRTLSDSPQLRHAISAASGAADWDETCRPLLAHLSGVPAR